MYRRRDKQGNPVGPYYISVGGVRRSARTKDRAAAKELEDTRNADWWREQQGLIAPTWERACLTWMDDNPVVAETYEAKKMLAFWTPHLKGKRLGTITPKLVHQIITAATWEDSEERRFAVDLRNPVPANSTANGYVSFVGRVIRHSSNINPKLTYYPKPQGRQRWASVQEWFQLEAKLSPDLRHVCTFALVTGLREANCMGFEWKWLHDNDTWALVPPEFTKTSKPYAIPLNLTAQAIVRERRDAAVRHPELVFLNGGDPWYSVSLCRQLKRAVQASEIPEFTFHCFRHTFASWLAQKGVDGAIRARLGCWASKGGMQDHYAHFDVESLRVFSELFDSIIKSGRAALDSQGKKSA